jgi:hypothetical protein
MAKMYEMNHTERSIDMVIIINNPKFDTNPHKLRESSEKDVEKMKKTFGHETTDHIDDTTSKTFNNKIYDLLVYHSTLPDHYQIKLKKLAEALDRFSGTVYFKPKNVSFDRIGFFVSTDSRILLVNFFYDDFISSFSEHYSIVDHLYQMNIFFMFLLYLGIF